MSTDDKEEIPWSNKAGEADIPWSNTEENVTKSTPMMTGKANSTPITVGQYTTTNATLAIIFSSIGAVLLLGSGGGGIFCAIPGIILANGALVITDSQPGHPDASMAKAAQIIGWIVTGLTVLLILVIVLGIAAIGGLGLMFGN
tara:strand:- start:129 stop:560 length:432 start_codon:yes stop_codon:yes gene_type:complete